MKKQLDHLSIIDTRKYDIIKTVNFNFEVRTSCYGRDVQRDTKKTHAFWWQVNEIAWSQDVNFLILTTGHGGVDVMKWPSLKRLCVLHAHTANCYCIKFSPSGEYDCLYLTICTLANCRLICVSRYFAVGSADALVSLWDVEDLTCLRTFSRLQYPIRTVSFTHDSKMIASASEDLCIDVVRKTLHLCA